LGLGAREGVEMTGYLPPAGVGAGGNAAPAAAAFPGARGQDPAALDQKEIRERILRLAGTMAKTGGAEALQALPAPYGQKADGALAAKVLDEVRALREEIREGGAGGGFHAGALPAAAARIEELLTLNDFTAAYKNALINKIRKECSFEEINDFDFLEERALEWIGDSVRIRRDREEDFPLKPRIIALVGPTGVGKTSTVAKLATSLGIGRQGKHIRNIALITIDAYRVAAKQQLETYGRIMEFPTFAASEYEELKRILALNSSGVDLILIDTIGRSPRDSEEIGAMRDVLEACGSRAEVFLTLSATTKARDLEEIIQRFEPFNFRSVIITKMDETMQTGNVISALADKGKAVSYITDGQTPMDLRQAAVIEFLIRLEGFKINREKLERRFSGVKN